MFGPLLKLATETALLAVEAQLVIAARMTQAALGRGSLAENQLMLTEKFLAATEAAGTLASGGSAHKVIKGYRRRVKANLRRLEREPGR